MMQSLTVPAAPSKPSCTHRSSCTLPLAFEPKARSFLRPRHFGSAWGPACLLVVCHRRCRGRARRASRLVLQAKGGEDAVLQGDEQQGLARQHEFEQQCLEHYREHFQGSTVWHWSNWPEEVLFESGLLEPGHRQRRLNESGSVESGLDGLAQNADGSFTGLRIAVYDAGSHVTAQDLAPFIAAQKALRTGNEARGFSADPVGVLYTQPEIVVEGADLLGLQGIQRVQLEVDVEKSQRPRAEKPRRRDESKLVPRPYQEQAIQALLKSSKTSRAMLLAMPYYTGKTFVMACWARRMAADVVVVVSPLRASAHENMERMRKFLPEHQAVRVWSGHCTTSEQIDMALQARSLISSTYTSAMEVLKALQQNSRSFLLIVEKAHNLTKEDAIWQLVQAADHAVLETSTPLKHVVELQGIAVAFKMTFQEAIQQQLMANYQLWLPDAVTKETALPVELKNFLGPWETAGKVLFLVNCMLSTGSSRCIVYCTSKLDCTAVEEAFKEVCHSYMGVGAWTATITEDVSERKRRSSLQDFVQDVEECAGPRKKILKILLSVRVLDESVDVPECDSVYFTYVPTSTTADRALVRSVQRLCRATLPHRRSKPQGLANAFLWTGLEDSRVTELFALLKDFDPEISKKIRVRSQDYDFLYTPRIRELETSDLKGFMNRFVVEKRPLRLSGQRPGQEAEEPGQRQLPKQVLQKQLTAKIANSTSAQDLLDILAPGLDTDFVDYIHISAAFSRLARHKASLGRSVQWSPLFSRFTAKTMEFLEKGEVPGRHCANVLWSIASLGQKGARMHELVPPLVERLSQEAPEMNQQGIALAVWAAASLQLPDKLLRLLLPPMTARLVQVLDTVDHQACGNIFWAMGSLKDRAPELLDIHHVLAPRAVQVASGMSAQSFSSILWTAATWKEEAPGLLQALPALLKATRTLKFQPHEGTDSVRLWAIGTVKEQAPELVQLLPNLLEELPQITRTFTPKCVSQTLSAYAMLQDDYPELWHAALPALCRAAAEGASRATPQDVSVTLHSLGQVDDGSPAVRAAMTQLLRRAEEVVREMPPVGLANSCYGLAQSRVPCKSYLDAVATSVTQGVGTWSRTCKHLALAKLVWVFAKFGYARQELLDTVVKEIEPELPGIPQWGLCALVWAFAQLKVKAPASFSQKVAAEFRRRQLGPEAVSKSEEGIGPFNKWYRSLSQDASLL